MIAGAGDEAGTRPARQPFAHGVASGDPTTTRVMIWTRVTTDDEQPVLVAWWVEDDAGSRVAYGAVEAVAESDWTVRVDVDGLRPASRYRYGFEGLGASSPVGRTRTLGAHPVDRLRIAQISCAKYNAGHFNALARLAERDDLDFVLHLGDYIYEASQTPPASQTASMDIGRPFDPRHECITLDDYRRRYAQYRADPDVQAFHAAHPMIATVDDHEFADGAWRDGATEHKPDRDGPWAARRAAAFRARWEWLPARMPDPGDPERVFHAVHVGGLADLFVLDIRTRRDKPVPPPGMNRADRTVLGVEQREWLLAGLAASRARWRLLGNPSVMARTWNDDLSAPVRNALLKVKLIDADLSGPDWDQWDGYPAERSAILSFVQRPAIQNVVVLSGDVHVGMAIELSDELGADEPVAVEFVNTSLTSQNLDDKMGWAPLTESVPVAEAFVAGMPHLRWCDFDSHGYSIVDVTAERVVCEWWAVDAILERHAGQRRVAAWAVRSGSTRLEEVDGVESLSSAGGVAVS